MQPLKCSAYTGTAHPAKPMSAALSPQVPVAAPRPAWRGNVSGALNGAASAAAVSVASATLVFAPLGPQYLPSALLACLIAAILGGLVAAVLGSMPVTVSATRSAVSLVIASLVATLVREFPALAPEVVIALAAITVVAAGALQAGAAAMNLGQLVRFVPFPVVAGFTHGIALTLVAIYVPLMLGITQVPRLAWPAGATVVPAAALLGIFTLVVVFATSGRRLRLPGVFLALVVGVVAHEVAKVFMPGLDVGSVLATAAMPAPASPLTDTAALSAALAEPAMLRVLASFAIAIALVASVDSLVGAMAVETRHGVRSQPDRDLIAQGMGNVVSGALGGVAITYSAVHALAAYAAGARDRLSGIAAPVFLLAAAAATVWWGIEIPLTVLAALMIFVAWRLADPWGFALLRAAWRERGKPRGALAGGLVVYATVAAAVVLLDIMTAIAVGIAVAAVIFLRTMNQHVVRRVIIGRAVRSRRLFPPAVSHSLSERMEEVAVIEMQGPLFFGTADRIIEEVRRLRAGVRFVVLDLARVQALDETAISVLARLTARLRSEKREILTCGAPPAPASVEGVLPRDFVDRDRAIEWIEERLLEEAGIDTEGEVVEVAALAQALGLDAAGAGGLGRHARILDLAAGSTVFRKDDLSDELYYLLAGRVSIMYEESPVTLRLVTLLPGNVFGDVAFVDGKPRSAKAVCDVASRVLVLDRAAIARIEEESPGFGTRLYATLATDIAGRLRATDRIVRDVL